MVRRAFLEFAKVQSKKTAWFMSASCEMGEEGCTDREVGNESILCAMIGSWDPFCHSEGAINMFRQDDGFVSSEQQKDHPTWGRGCGNHQGARLAWRQEDQHRGSLRCFPHPLPLW